MGLLLCTPRPVLSCCVSFSRCCCLQGSCTAAADLRCELICAGCGTCQKHKAGLCQAHGAGALQCRCLSVRCLADRCLLCKRHAPYLPARCAPLTVFWGRVGLAASQSSSLCGMNSAMPPCWYLAVAEASSIPCSTGPLLLPPMASASPTSPAHKYQPLRAVYTHLHGGHTQGCQGSCHNRHW